MYIDCRMWHPDSWYCDMRKDVVGCGGDPDACVLPVAEKSIYEDRMYELTQASRRMANRRMAERES